MYQKKGKQYFMLKLSKYFIHDGISNCNGRIEFKNRSERLPQFSETQALFLSVHINIHVFNEHCSAINRDFIEPNLSVSAQMGKSRILLCSIFQQTNKPLTGHSGRENDFPCKQKVVCNFHIFNNLRVCSQGKYSVEIARLCSVEIKF